MMISRQSTSKRFNRAFVILIGTGLLALPVYIWFLSYGPFRPLLDNAIETFLVMFGLLFALYSVATVTILRSREFPRHTVLVIFLFGALFNGIVLFSRPTLSDDMYRYVWDGRVQLNGVNPYRYPSNANELSFLHDDLIWGRMNRIGAVTIYPPGAQIVFALLYRVIPDSITGYKLFFIGCIFICGWLLVKLLRHFDLPAERVLILMWNPLLVIEIAHSGHVDALYLPLIVAAMLLRIMAPADRVSVKYEIGIGFLLGLATLAKLYPAILIIPLWSLRTADGKRRWRLALPITVVITVGIGYFLYIAPGVNVLGFLSSYNREYFNVGPIPMGMMLWAESRNIDFFIPVNIAMPVLIIVASLLLFLFPARTARNAVLRCAIPIGIYLFMSQNLLPWYLLWMLPLLAITLRWRIDASLGWWFFSGLVALSYTVHINGMEMPWVGYTIFVPLYSFLIISFARQSIRLLIRFRNHAFRSIVLEELS